MKTITYPDFRNHLEEYMRQVNENGKPLVVTSKNPGDDVVVLGKNDYDAIMETLAIINNGYLMGKIARGDKQFKVVEDVAPDNN